MNTHETYVSFETAKLLKEARFDWECTAPTLCVAQIWLMEKYNLFAMVEYDYRKNLFRCKIYSKAECLSILFDYSTYEEALEAGIHKALKIILEEGE